MVFVKSKGFIFIILIIVFAFILGLIGLFKLAQKNRDISRKADLEKIQYALEKFYTERGEYPPLQNDQFCISFKDVPELKELLTSYLEKPEKGFPSDPKWKNTEKNYFYRRLDPASFKLYAELERKEKNDNLYLVSDCSQNQNAFDYIISEAHEITHNY